MIELETLQGTRFGLIADAHIHPGETPPFPDKLKETFAGCDAILALGDMGESSGLDWLEQIAPVRAIRGGDDPSADPRVSGDFHVFAHSRITVVTLFDGVKHGLFESSDPLALASDFAAVAARLFHRKPDVLLCASTHRPLTAFANGILIVNPGSPTLANPRTVALLDVSNGVVRVEHVVLS